ncbi:uroporphyrinogen-III synthase [Auraticoccus monumenti]|uniref:Uroporphyrinogen-III synthase n=1 Tax=Auraticoccus monumenti TaxID=675864 RepID=A0A1G7DIP0_9ACTN|nr:uroporphyrinogen-III synthase [Auraticoccus monumenti]SDE51381.1 uroporphyrinogen-III synthase [Auraticoccus monumenti]
MTSALDPVMAGCVVLVTADRRSGELASALTRRGATVRHAPALSIVPHQEDEQLVADTRALLADPPDVLVVTTGIGLRGWIEAADVAGLADELVSTLAGARIIARGPKARGAIQAAGLQADWVAESETSAEILELLLDEGVTGTSIAVQHHGAGADGLDTELAAAGASVRSLVVYRWGPPPDPVAVRESVLAAARGELDAVVFTSAPGAAAWLAAVVEQGVLEAVVERTRAGCLVAAAVGPVTARPLQEHGIEPLVPERGRLGALVRTLIHHFEQAATTAVGTRQGPLQVRRTVALLDGHVLPVSPSGLEVLRALADARGGVVSREELLRVLPGDSSDPHTAEVAVARLREAVGRDLVQTVVRRGYRLAVGETVGG